GLAGAISLTVLRPPGGLFDMFRTPRPRGSRVGLAAFPLTRARDLARSYDCKVNDVVLAVLCGALRSWILSCGHPLTTADTLRVRLAQISRETRTQREAREAVGAKSWARRSGFAPPTLHALGSRAAIMLPSDSYDLVVTNAPGPQHGMFWGDGRLDAVYPIP